MLFRPLAAKRLRHNNAFNPFATLTRTLDRAAPISFALSASMGESCRSDHDLQPAVYGRKRMFDWKAD